MVIQACVINIRRVTSFEQFISIRDFRQLFEVFFNVKRNQKAPLFQFGKIGYWKDIIKHKFVWA